MLLEARNLRFRYGKGEYVLKDINISISSGERVGLVAKSGFGKSTLAKILAGYEKPTKGQILLNGIEVSNKGYNPIQLIYQNPEKAVNPRWKVRDILKEVGFIDYDLIDSIGIERDWLTRYPRELSGGELQRVSVARSLSGDTKFLIADEISTMLDVITQAQIWEIILRHAKERDLGLLVITHNMHLARRVCTRIIDLEVENKNGE